MLVGDTVRTTAAWYGLDAGRTGSIIGFYRREGGTHAAVKFEGGVALTVPMEVLEVVPTPPDEQPD